MTLVLRQPFDGDFQITLGFNETYPGLYSDLNRHKGIDYGCPYGTRILAAADGVVLEAAYDSAGYGNYVLIKHENGSGTLYGHLQTTLVQPGTSVAKGDLIGLSGATGNVTGAHLHFEYRSQANKIDTVADPMLLMQSVESYKEDNVEDVTGTEATIVCYQANLRDCENNLIGTLNLGTKVTLTGQTHDYKGLPYHEINGGFWVAAYDSFGTQILKGIS